MEREKQKNEKNNYRKIDGEFEEVMSWWKKSFIIIRKTQIKTWKAMSIIAFIGGIASATIMLVSLEMETSSQASLAPAKIFFSPSSVNLIEGETFNVDLVIDTADSNVVVVNSIVLYDKSYFELVGWSTTDSIFKFENECLDNTKPCEIINNDTSNSRIGIVFASPSPGVNTEAGKLATLSFKALRSVNSSSAIRLSFIRQGDYEDSDVIIDDGTGTDTLASVGVLATSIRPVDVAELIVSDGLPSGELSSSTTSVTMTVKTDMNATCKYSTISGTTYENMRGIFSTTGQKVHSQLLENLNDGNSYSYYVRCEELSGKQNSNDFIVSFSVADNLIDEIDDSGEVVVPVVDEPVVEPPARETPGDTPAVSEVTTPAETAEPATTVPNPSVVYDGGNEKLSRFNGGKSIKFSANIKVLAGGKIQIFENDKFKKEAHFDSEGKLSIGMNFKKSTEITVKYFDLHGVQVYSKKYNIKIDSEKPVIADIPSVLKKRAGDKIWWSGSDNKGIAYYKYKIDGVSKETKKTYFYIPYKTGKGPHNISITAYDKAGNKTTKHSLIWIW